MKASPRAFVLAALLALTLLPVPQAAASDCVEVLTQTYGDGLRVIANAGRQIAIGAQASTLGDGTRVVVVITPAVCGGLGVGISDMSGQSPAPTVDDAYETLASVPSFLPLP